MNTNKDKKNKKIKKIAKFSEKSKIPIRKILVQKTSERKITEIKDNVELIPENSEQQKEFSRNEVSGRIIVPILERKEIPQKRTLEEEIQEVKIEKSGEKENKKGKLKQDVYSAAEDYNQQVYESLQKYRGEKEIAQISKESAKQLVEGIKMFDTRSKFQKDMIKSQETMNPKEFTEEPKYEFQKIEEKKSRIPGLRHEREEIISEKEVRKYRVHGK